jgi:CubicO group peptidase (beta-lactamase class C family)
MRSIRFVGPLVLLCQIVGAQSGVAEAPIPALPIGDPDAAGVSRERLERVMLLLDGEVKAGRIAGAVFGVERHGKLVWLQATGFRDKTANLPMTTDSLFPLASMTKPIASVAAMMLVEQGKLALRDPVAKYLPAFKDVQVAKEWQGGAPGTPGPIATEKLARPITIQDLLRHTSGLVNGSLFSRTPVRVAYVNAGVYQEPQTLAEEVDKIAKLPLAYQPGSAAGRTADRCAAADAGYAPDHRPLSRQHRLGVVCARLSEVHYDAARPWRAQRRTGVGRRHRGPDARRRPRVDPA